MIKVSPSILAADFSRLGEEVSRVEEKASMLHIDVMDGHFVPNISLGIPVVASIRKETSLFFDVHLMISQPDRYLEDFAKAGADLICFHHEAEGDTAHTIEKIRALGKKAAVSVKPGTPAEEIYPYVPDLDMVLIMTVEPGFGGQAFMPEMLDKITALRRFADRENASLDIEVDGGINPQTAKQAVGAGANVLVAGSYIFDAPDPNARIDKLKAV